MRNALDVVCSVCGALAGMPCSGYATGWRNLSGEPWNHLSRGPVEARHQGLEEGQATEEPLLPGWTCTTCGVFNGSAKDLRTHCRCCESPGPLHTPAPETTKKWKVMFRCADETGVKKLYRGPFASYAEARHERTKGLASDQWDEAWVYEVETLPRRRKKSA